MNGKCWSSWTYRHIRVLHTIAILGGSPCDPQGLFTWEITQLKEDHLFVCFCHQQMRRFVKIVLILIPISYSSVQRNGKRQEQINKYVRDSVLLQ